MLQQFNIISIGNSTINKVGLLSVGRIKQVIAGPGGGSTLIYLKSLKNKSDFVNVIVQQTPAQTNSLMAGSVAGSKAVLSYNNGSQNVSSIITVDNIAWAFSTGNNSCEFFYETELSIPLQRFTTGSSLSDFRTAMNSSSYNFDVLGNGIFLEEGSTRTFTENESGVLSIFVDRLSFPGDILVTLTDVSGYFGGSQSFTIPSNSSAAQFNILADSVIPDGTYELIIGMTGSDVQTKSYFIQIGSGSGSGSGSGGGGCGTLNVTPGNMIVVTGTITQNSPYTWTVDPTTSIGLTTNELGSTTIFSGKWTIVKTTPVIYTVAYVPGPSTALINGIVPVVASSISVASGAEPGPAGFSGVVNIGTISF